MTEKVKRKLKEKKSIIKKDKEVIQGKTKGKVQYAGVTILVRQNDITDEPVDAIVNPANENLDN